MGQKEILILIGVIGAVLFIIALKKKVEWLMNFVMRAVLGTLAILAVNYGFWKLGEPAPVGLNPISVLTSAILGFPGLAALYGIQIYKSL